ncbi:MAG TPA: response regulator, partial [Burkholderiales bacterium]|nr:response regulator [Burkholderiales bacterium]
ANEAADDRADIHPGDRCMLIVENDVAFAKVLLEAVREQGFKGLVSGTGAGALAMARDFRPTAITLDIFLPDMQGWRVLDRLKADLSTRHIPVCVVSTDEARARAYESGALGFLAKPVASRELVEGALRELTDFAARGRRNLLLAMPAGEARRALAGLLACEDLEVRESAAPAEALERLRSGDADCLVAQAGLLDPERLAEALENRPRPLPVVVYDPDGTAGRPQGDDRVVQRAARSVERAADLACFFLHRPLEGLADPARRALETLHSSSSVLAGRTALIVDDDMRNIFALATVLHDEGMRIASANNGREAIRLVTERADIDIVLMDIMMPEMDGIATMQEIRKLPRGRDLPMVAVTAKAMKGDRERCIQAGAWDYLSKPVDMPHLMTVLRGWLHR